MTPMAQMAQNQFQQGLACAQQAMLAEQMGNLMGAVQAYDQAIAMMGGAMGMAAQSGVPVYDSGYFNFAFCNFNAARLKSAAGWLQFAPMHLAQAHQALSQAIAINPNFFPYHSAIGLVLLAEGNVVMAAQAFQRAIQLNPMDSWSQWMLASLYSAQGNAAASQQCYAAATQTQPHLPPPQQFLQQHQGFAAGKSDGHATAKDWIGLAEGALKFGTAVAGLFQQGGQGEGQGQPMWGGNQFS